MAECSSRSGGQIYNNYYNTKEVPVQLWTVSSYSSLHFRTKLKHSYQFQQISKSSGSKDQSGELEEKVSSILKSPDENTSVSCGSENARPRLDSNCALEEAVGQATREDESSRGTSRGTSCEDVNPKYHARFGEPSDETGSARLSTDTSGEPPTSSSKRPKRSFGFAEQLLDRPAEIERVRSISIAEADEESEEYGKQWKPGKQRNKECDAFLKFDSFAEVFVDEILEPATEVCEKRREREKLIEVEGVRFALHDKDKSGQQQQDPEATSLTSTITPTSSLAIDWPTIGEFTEALGLYKIEEYVSLWYFQEDWKYCINFLNSVSDKTADVYHYEVIFSVPCKVYPIPQATASIYFTLEASRVKPKCCLVDVFYQFECNRFVHTPGKYPFQEAWLFNIVDAKIKFYRTLRF